MSPGIQQSPEEQARKEAMQKRVVAVLFAVLAVVVLWQFLPSFSGGGGGTVITDGSSDNRGARARGRRGASSDEAIPDEVVELNLEALDPGAESYRIGRNLWAFYIPPPPPPPPPPPVIRQPPPPPPPPPPPVVRVPQPPAITFDYLGSFGPERKRIAVLGSDAELINALEGDVVEGEFIVAEIGYESVLIRFVNFPDAPPVRLEVGR